MKERNEKEKKRVGKRQWRSATLVAAACFAAALVGITRGDSRPASKMQWQKVWGDDFDGARLDNNKWTSFQTGNNYNNELQHYMYDEVWLHDGALTLNSRRRAFTGPDGAREYTSGKVSTARKFSFLYGTVEMRAKMPAGRGVWPAFWMLPASEKSWPPEIDIFEMLGHEPHTLYLSNHRGLWPNHKADSTSFTGPDFSENFHTYTLEWAPGWLRWKIDGITRKEVTTDVPNQPMYLILNTAVGGKWPGAPDQGTVFPQHFRIDYIHVYQSSR